jgi:hypothetical protein
MNSTLTFACTWEDADGNPIHPKPRTIQIPCTVGAQGAIPVPPGTASGTEVDVPFPGILSAATLVVIENETGQELNVAWGGNWAPHLPAGATLIYAMPAVPAAGAITSLRFMLTQQQVGAGLINYTVLGS